jgi:hypothetical protein
MHQRCESAACTDHFIVRFPQDRAVAQILGRSQAQHDVAGCGLLFSLRVAERWGG